MNKNLLSLLLFLSLGIGLSAESSAKETEAAEKTPAQKRTESLLDWVRYAHPFQHYPWSCNSNLEWARMVNKRFGKRSKNENCFDLTRVFEKSTALHQQVGAAPSIYERNQLLQDLELVAGKPDARECSLTNTLHTGRTLYGKVSLALLLSLPEHDVTCLRARQGAIKQLLADEETYLQCDQLLKDIAAQEGNTISLLDDKHLARSVRWTKKFHTPGIRVFNRSRWSLLGREYYYRLKDLAYLGLSIWGLYNLSVYGARAVYTKTAGNKVPAGWGMSEYERDRVHARSGDADLLWERVWQKFHKPWIHGPMALFAAYIGTYGVKRTVENMMANWIQDQMLHRAIRSLAITLNSAKQLYYELAPHAAWRSLADVQPLFTFFEESVVNDAQLRELMTLLRQSTFSASSTTRFHMGNIIRGYLVYEKCQEKLYDVITAIGRVDAYVGLARRVKEAQGTQNRWCFAQYVTDKPTLHIAGMWNPFLAPEKAVANDIALGGTQSTQHYIITGPNAAGKSTNLKGMALAALLAQSCGLVPARRCVISPFHVLETYLNISDDLQNGHSLFEKEAMRASELLARVSTRGSQHKPALLIFDEMFNGTTPYEGMSAAYSVAAHLAKRPNVLSVVATHFSQLTALPQTYPNMANMHVSVQPLRNGRWHRSYTLGKGVSDQHIALDMLREKGLESDIVDMARNVLADATKRTG